MEGDANEEWDKSCTGRMAPVKLFTNNDSGQNAYTEMRYELRRTGKKVYACNARMY